jgi:hypothetical protein
MVRLDPERAELAYGVPADIEVFTTSELRQFYDPRGEKRVTEKAISLELQKQNAAKIMHGTQLQIEGMGRVRLYALRDVVKWRLAKLPAVHQYMRYRKMPTPKY